MAWTAHKTISANQLAAPMLVRGKAIETGSGVRGAVIIVKEGRVVFVWVLRNINNLSPELPTPPLTNSSGRVTFFSVVRSRFLH